MKRRENESADEEAKGVVNSFIKVLERNFVKSYIMFYKFKKWLICNMHLH